MSVENVAVVQGLYDAFARGDMADALGRMDPGIEWNEAENFPYADGNPYRGPDAVLTGVFARCATEWEGFAVDMPDLIDGGDRVVALGRYAGTFPATGTAMRPQVAHVWTLRDGRIVGFQQYADTLHVARVMGR